MPQTYRYLLHTNGPALWPDFKPLAEVLELQATTPEGIWLGTYQGNPTPPAGTVFQRDWWNDCRFHAGDRSLINQCVARWQSWDTGLKDEEDNAYSACVTGELWPDYRMAIREVYRERLKFPALPEKIAYQARRHNADGKLRGVIIEDKASGISAYQTLCSSLDNWLTELLVAFQPSGDKETRANQGAVWCKNGCVWLPHPSDQVPWLVDFEDELFNFPGSSFKDQVDALDQLILWTENLLAEGWKARNHATRARLDA
jgi:predicted phage terminase large subunit-like protein